MTQVLRHRYATNLKELLTTATTKDLTLDIKYFFVNSSDTVGQVLQALKEKKLTAIPVRCSQTGRFLGFVEIVDILAVLLKAIADPNASVTLEALLQQFQTFSLKAVAEVIGEFGSL